MEGKHVFETCSGSGPHIQVPGPAAMGGWAFEAIPGFFKQDDVLANPGEIGAAPARFGLLDRSPDRWTRFKSRIDDLNTTAEPGSSYKVIFFARHGEGFHNVAEAHYGTALWDSHYAMLNGDGQIVWGPDPEITALGESQARILNSLWKTEMAAGIPVPQKGYCSPLTRAMRTAVISFDGVILNTQENVIVVENCREVNGRHACDKRRSKSYIRAEFPQLGIESGLTEEDELWGVERELLENVRRRARHVLETIFGNDRELYISITAHGGIIEAALEELGRPFYGLPTGGVLPVVVKGTRS